MGWLWWFLLVLGMAQDPGPPTWPDGAVMSISSMGLGNLLLSWPVAENNVYELVGYRVYMSASESGSLSRIFDGQGSVEIRQYLVSGLNPGYSYSFYIEALNIDPSGTIVLGSNYLFRSYTLGTPVGVDPTIVDSPLTITAGVPFSLNIAGRHPYTGNLQDVGPVCLVTEKASCIPGRTFVAYIEPLCELVDLNSRCKPLAQSSTDGEYGPVAVAYDENNNGQYTVEIDGEVASGDHALAIQAITPNQLLGVYWANPTFLGDPADTRLDPMIDFHWGFGPLVAWVSEFVSIRWTGYVKPESSGEYSLVCFANTYCDVWIDKEHLISSNGGQVACISGCMASRPLSLYRSHYYRLKVEYVTTTGDSFVSLQWKDTSGLFPSLTPIPSSVFQRGAYISTSPVTVTVLPEKLSHVRSFVYGSEEALFNPMAGKTYTLFVQGNDAFGNACKEYNRNDSIVAHVNEAFAVTAAPHNSTLSDCVYSFPVTYKSAGSGILSVSINGQLVSNSPISIQVSPGHVDALTISDVDVSPLLVNTTLTVTVDLVDAFGNPSSLIELDSLSYRIERDPSVVVTSLNGCGSRSDVTWKVYCWNGEFSFVDDSQLAGQTFPPFARKSASDEISIVNDHLVIRGLGSYYAGAYLLTLLVGDTMVTGAPVPVLLEAGSNQAVNATMSLVEFSYTDTPIVAFESDVNARLLIRDSVGNVLTDRDSVDVRLVFNYTDNPSTTEIACQYVPNKYYDCMGYAEHIGQISVSVLVEGHIASMTRGSPPISDTCIKSAFCGSLACPCSQRRIPATIELEVVSD